MTTPPEILEQGHVFRFDIPGCKVCKKCGMAEHKTKYEGFKYWLAGVGHHEPPKCE
jgi:hypothetical protein